MAQSPTPPIIPPPSPPALGSAVVRWACTCHLVGLPELKLFRDPSAKARALDEIGDGKIGGVVGVLTKPWILMLISGSVTVPVLFLRPSVRILHLPGNIAFYADMALLLGVFCALILLHRPFAARHLRRRLVDSGIPVCVGCGYDLRGLAPLIRGGLTCPECGAEVSPETVALLTTCR